MARLRSFLPFVAPAAALLYFASGFLWGRSPDEEEYRNAILSTTLHARALLDGVYPFWTSDLGFGLPHPEHPAFLLHPLSLLFGLLPPDVALRVLYAVHAVLGTAGCWWLVRRLGAGVWVAGLAAATWTLSTPTVNYALTDLWPSHFVAWSLFPFLLLLALRILDAEGPRQPWRAGVAFGVAAGLVVANGHAGHIPILLVALAFFFAAELRRTWRRVPTLALATAIGVAIAAPTYAVVLSELRQFPEVPRVPTTLVPGWREIVEMVTRPFITGPEQWSMAALFDRGARRPFFGGPWFLLALAGCAGVIARPRPGLVAGFVASLVCMMSDDLQRLRILSAVSTFRDPMTLCGIALGSGALQSIVARRRVVAASVGALQLVVLAVAAWPFVADTWEGARSEALFRPTRVAAALTRWARVLPGRWYVAPELDDLIRTGHLFDDGLWPDGWAYRRIPVVNGTFKGESADSMYPSATLPLGQIRGEAATVQNADTLDVLGIGVVLATDAEPVAATLEETARFPLESTGGRLRLLRNPGAWPGAGFVDGRVMTMEPAVSPGCAAGGVLCRDLSGVKATAPDARVVLTRRHGTIGVRFAAADSERYLLVSEMYREHWRASSGSTALTVTPVFGALIGVTVPPGVDEVQLSYRPVVLVVLTWVAYATLVAALVWLAAVGIAGRRARGARGTDRRSEDPLDAAATT